MTYQVEAMVETPAGLGHVQGTKQTQYVEAADAEAAEDLAWELLSAGKDRFPDRSEWTFDIQPGAWVDGRFEVTVDDDE